MSCTIFIRERMDAFTATEARLARYLLSHSAGVVRMTAREFAEAAGVSPAAAVRFSKRLGFQGFLQLRLDLARELAQGEPLDEFQTAIRDNDDMETLLRKAERIHIRNLSLTCRMVEPAVLSRAVEEIRARRRIHLFGVGASGLLAMDFLYKSSRIGIPAFYHSDVHTNLATASLLGPEDAAIAISYSGETRETVLAARTARERGAWVIAITCANGNTLSGLADCVLYVPREEREHRVGAMTSRMSGQLLLDLLYLGIAKEDPEGTQQSLRQTRELIRAFQSDKGER
ncbi:MAG: MurR/RpiR family transcriptional regulator [Angelakisella sp.]|jgi:RpiR family murPQ operon transcriptional repressor|nr:MurR/RpiR family transcriptional regulator [Angelakisella sp.]